jgi:hypothetical protein
MFKRLKDSTDNVMSRFLPEKAREPNLVLTAVLVFGGLVVYVLSLAVGGVVGLFNTDAGGRVEDVGYIAGTAVLFTGLLVFLMYHQRKTFL